MATSKKTTKSTSSGSKKKSTSSRAKTGAASGGKKTSGNKAASGKRTASGKQSASGKRTARRPVDYRPRLIGGCVCFFLAIFSSFGYFGVEAILIDLLVDGERGLVGYGFWVTPVMLLWAGIILLLSRGMPVRLRTTFALLTPVLVGGLAQAISWSGQYALEPGLPLQLWQLGIQLDSGGLLGGLLAALLTIALSKAGAILVFAVLLVADLLILTKKTPSDVAQACRDANQRRQERRAERQAEWDEDGDYLNEPDFPPEPEPVLPTRPSSRGRKAAKAVIDIPVDDRPETSKANPRPAAAEQAPAPEPAEPTGRMPIFQKREDKPLFQEQKGGKFFDQFFDKEPPVEEPARDYRPKASAGQPNPELPVEEPAGVTLPPLEEPKQKAAQEKAEQARASAEVARDLDEGMRSIPEYVHPPIDLLAESKAVSQSSARGELQEVQEQLDGTIHDFGIDAKVVGAVRGPTVTRYELELERGVKLSKVTNLADDIALTLGAKSVRIAPIPGKSLVVGVEVPNRVVTPVPIRDVLESNEFQRHKSNVAFAVGKDISGRNVVGNISKLPHMLIAGTTGSGKSVCTNSIIVSLLYKSSPEQVRLIMIDPKMVELSVYNGIPHLLIPVVTDPKKAAGALQWAVTEMLKRYRLFSERHVRDLESYNQQVEADLDTEETAMPQIVVFIDELADLMLVASKEVEEAICRLAQMGRAAGMHLIIATQRPSTDVITGLMKANIPSRIALSVSSGLESRIILDTQGAEKLIGNGDMLYSPVGSGKPLRVQGCYIDEEEINQVVAFIKAHSESDYDDSVMQEVEQNAENAGKGSKKGGSTLPDSTIPEPGPASGPSPEDGDPMLNEAIDVVVETGMASVSMLQRRLKLGYSRAARLVDQMEEKGVVGPFEGSKPRKVLVTKEQWAERKLQGGTVTTFGEASAISQAADQEAMVEEVDMPPFEV
ncbi:MAG: DNA translocase FtsK 4TM domain-containing protein [Candidatus Onthomonas sp.]